MVVPCLAASPHLSAPANQSMVDGSPRQWSRRTLRSVRRMTWRRTSAATKASSRGPTTGMNSGIRSIGETAQARANQTQNFVRFGTRGSPTSPRNRMTRFGSRARRLRAWCARPKANSNPTNRSHTATPTTKAVKSPRSMVSRLVGKQGGGGCAAGPGFYDARGWSPRKACPEHQQSRSRHLMWPTFLVWVSSLMGTGGAKVPANIEQTSHWSEPDDCTVG
jgi:hypothetical protein